MKKKSIFNVVLLLLPAILVAGIFDYRFSNYFWPNFDGAQMFDYFSVLTAYVVVLLLAFLASYEWKAKFHRIHAVILLLLGGIVIAGLHFEVVEPQIKSFIVQVIVNYLSPMLVFLIAFESFRRSEKLRINFEKVFLLSFSLLGMLCIFEYFTDLLPGENRDFLNRLVWPYIDPFVGMKAESANWLAYLFGPTALISAIHFMKKREWLPVASFVIAMTVLMLSKSYTGIGITGILLAAIVFFQVPKKWKKWVVLVCIVLGVLGVASQYNTPKFQVLLGNYHMPNSIERRAQIYSFTWESMKAHPIAGIGPGNYQSYFRVNQADILAETIPEVELPPHPHNLLMNSWSDLGIIGLLAFLILYTETGWAILKDPRKHIYYLVFAYPLGHGLFDVPYGLEEVSMIFWILLALAVSSRTKA